MNFPTKNFCVIKTILMTPKYFTKYGNSCHFKPLISDNDGERWLCYFKKGFKMEPHDHNGRYEWYVIKGKFKMTNPTINHTVILEPGDYYCNPPKLPHCHECLEDGEILWIYNQKENHD